MGKSGAGFFGVEEQNLQRDYGEMAYEYTCDWEWV